MKLQAFMAVLVILALAITPGLIQAIRNRTLLRLCLFSPVKGAVRWGGRPIPGAVVKRHWYFISPSSDQTITDANGEFSLPGVYTRNIFWQFVTSDICIKQEIHVEINGTSLLAWRHAKTDFQESEELVEVGVSPDGRPHPLQPIILNCDLNNEVKRHGGFSGYTGFADLQSGSPFESASAKRS